MLDQGLAAEDGEHAENSAEPTNSQHTMAVVLAVRNTASLVRFQSSVRAWKASRNAPAAPTAADWSRW